MIEKKLLKKYFTITALILAGEVIFLLPFVVTRIYRPTFLAVFDINNFELGSAFSVYGITAMISYFLGGPIADRFESRKLISFSLVVTSLAGFIMAKIPSLLTLTILYGFWGVTTILLFWAAFTKATRVWGGIEDQGKAFGLVDGGRGLVAALLASLSVIMIDFFIPESIAEPSVQVLSNALSNVIYAFSLFTLCTAIITWLAIPKYETATIKSTKIDLEGLRYCLRKKSVWIQSGILLCAYVAYKCTDDFSLFAYDVLHYDDVSSAHIATIAFWMRPVAALGAGLLGDKYLHSKIVSVCFMIIIAGGLTIYSGLINENNGVQAVITIAAISAGIFGLRGLYYALFKESDIPLKYTGSAVGVVSVIGFTPDVFFGPLMGYLLDEFPGSRGHEYLFGLLAIIGMIGIIASYFFTQIKNNISNSYE
ncbi:MFS transporter [Fulvivirga lutea]|uniref:MFS transporter n=1 Tax=Fulvivirga lutea TaxID=2810512 RepID=A0A974WG89_9BACT|nr:MFS transporter [Fulvivirga lutea]QSE96592.1 MFS transporter [Fulvivirga lutea]